VVLLLNINPTNMLQNLPLEILHQVLVELPSARDLSSLSLCCHFLYDVIRQEGWKLFAREKFPSLANSVATVDNSLVAARSLVSLSRSWDRRSFLAQDMPSTSMITHGQHDPYSVPQPHHRPRQFNYRGQTMGFVPVIDSFEEIVDRDWCHRRELVCWTAGTSIAFRYETKRGIPSATRDGLRHRQFAWGVYLQQDAVEGRDDFTALRLIKPSTAVTLSPENILSFPLLVGTAAGQLLILHLKSNSRSHNALCHTKQILQTTSSSLVRNVDLSLSHRLAIASFADGTLNIFDISTEDERIIPIALLNVASFGHLWTAKFLSDDLIAVGTGKSLSPLQTYALGPSGLVQEPGRIWKYFNDNGVCIPSSVKSILPLPQSFQSGGSPNAAKFLSGCSSGTIMLHDLRSSRHHEAKYFDPIDHSSVYSLLSKGRERIVAGASHNTLLKTFDLRMTGGRNYNYTSGIRDLSKRKLHDRTRHSGWSVFVHPNNPHENDQRQRHRFWNSRIDLRALQSAVYSLSTPSEFSSTFYAGLMDRVVEFDVVDVFDGYPDLIYGIEPSQTFTPKQSWNAKGRALDLSAYAHDTPNVLMKQSTDWHFTQDIGLDSRWRSVAELNQRHDRPSILYNLRP
jgi:hypothetical protein